MRNLLALLSISILLGACKEQAPTTYSFPKAATVNFDDQIELIKVGSKAFDLDSSIGITNQSLVYYQNDNSGKLSIFNEFDGSVHLFDYNSGLQESKIRFQREGDNGIGKKSNMGHFMTSEDSIFLINHWEKRVYLMNKNSEIIKKYELSIDDLKYEFYLLISPTSPIFKHGNKLYITSQSSGFSMQDTRYLIELDLIDSSIEWHIQGPDFMDKAFWGPVTPYTFSTTFNRKESTIVTSMAKNPEVREFDLNDLQHPPKTKIVGSKFVDSFTSFEKKNDQLPMFGHDYKKIASETNKKPLFYSIQYDQVNDLYYRTMFLERSQDQYELRQRGIQQSIIITDNDFNKIGETKLPRGEYKPGFSFINKNGLHLANLSEYEKNENKLVFDIFLPVKKQK